MISETESSGFESLVVANKTRRPRRAENNLGASQAAWFQGRDTLFDNSITAPNKPIFDAIHPTPSSRTKPTE